MNDELVPTEDLESVFISFSLVHRPNTDDALLASLLINGIPVEFGKPTKLPSDQGLMWFVGMWAPGSKFDVSWTFQSRNVRSADFLAAVVPNNKLTKMIRLQQYQVEPYSTYEGSGKVTVPAMS